MRGKKEILEGCDDGNGDDDDDGDDDDGDDGDDGCIDLMWW